MSKNAYRIKVLTGAQARRISRRHFLRGAMMAGAGLLAACAADDVAREPETYRTPTPFRSLAATPVARQATEGAAPEGSIGLKEFLQVSSLLTGVENLDPVLGQVYLQALQAGGGEGPSLAAFFSAASSGSGPAPGEVETLQASGFFEQAGYSGLADQIIEMWYTGVIQKEGEAVVVTYVDALAWKVLEFTKPPTICGQFGFWAKEPNVQISPGIQYTPVPMQEGQ